LEATPAREEEEEKILQDAGSLPRPAPLDANAAPLSEVEYASSVVHGRGVHLPFFHRRTHDIPVANIQFRSHHPYLLDLFTHFATHAAYSLGIPISRVCYLPTKRTLWTVPRSPFIHKKSQENFERRVHKRMIKAWDADPEVVERWCAYLRHHALGGVGMRVTKWERMPLGIGATRLAHAMGGLEGTGDSQKIKALGEKIVKEEMREGSTNKISHKG
jgi:small subunit ribosomal protein S10